MVHDNFSRNAGTHPCPWFPADMLSLTELLAR